MNPSEIARQALKRLAQGMIPPTPENYSAIYKEIAGITSPDVCDAGGAMDSVAARHPILRRAIQSGDWAKVAAEIERAFASLGAAKQNRVLINGVLERIGVILPGRLKEVERLLSVKSRDGQAFAGAFIELLDETQEMIDVERRRSASIVDLFSLTLKNIEGMVEDGSWVAGQAQTITELLNSDADRHAITDAESSLRRAIQRQETSKDEIDDARSALSSLMGGVIEQVGSIASTTGEYQSKVEGYRGRLERAREPSEIGRVVSDIILDTSEIHDVARRSREDLESTREQMNAAEGRIKALEAELVAISEKVMKDHLTGALNRRGLAEAFEREFSRSDRNGEPVSVALLDIDNFKRLNDGFGHQAGDQALVMLSEIVMESVRPTDAVARYGGEEFVILMPNTNEEDAIGVVERLQRALTKRFFLYGEQKLLITFSAGVAQRKSGEPRDIAINRADRAMYRAKQAGKNRVCRAD